MVVVGKIATTVISKDGVHLTVAHMVTTTMMKNVGLSDLRTVEMRTRTTVTKTMNHEVADTSPDFPEERTRNVDLLTIVEVWMTTITMTKRTLEVPDIFLDLPGEMTRNVDRPTVVRIWMMTMTSLP